MSYAEALSSSPNRYVIPARRSLSPHQNDTTCSLPAVPTISVTYDPFANAKMTDVQKLFSELLKTTKQSRKVKNSLSSDGNCSLDSG